MRCIDGWAHRICTCGSLKCIWKSCLCKYASVWKVFRTPANLPQNVYANNMLFLRYFHAQTMHLLRTDTATLRVRISRYTLTAALGWVGLPGCGGGPAALSRGEMSLMEVQCHLDKEGASDLVIDLIMNTTSDRVFQGEHFIGHRPAGRREHHHTGRSDPPDRHWGESWSITSGPRGGGSCSAVGVLALVFLLL